MLPSAKSTLSKTIRTLRTRLTTDFGNALEGRYRLGRRVQDAALDPGRQAEREHIEAYLDEMARGEEQKPTKQRRSRQDFIAESVRQAAYTLINRLVLLRLMEEAELVRPALLKGGWQSPAYREWREFAPALLADETDGYATLLNLMFDELAHDLPGLYGSVGLTEFIPLPPQTLRAAVEALNAPALEPCWSDDTTLGWVYQYFNDPDREALDAKLNARGKVEPHEVASKTQLFTERYMVEWLLQNSLGPIWFEVCERNGWEPEVKAQGVLDALEARRVEWRGRRERGEVELDALMPIEAGMEDRWKYYVPPAEDRAAGGGAASKSIEAPDVLMTLRELKLLDPACGSGHFLVIAFDLLFALYQEEARHRGESWSDAQITSWIIEDNLHGIDIDPRAVQIAAAALYLKGRLAAPTYRPERLNLVAPDLTLGNLPDDDPALVELRRAVEAETGIPGALVDTIVHSLKEAHHLGTLLKVDEEIDAALRKLESQPQGDLWQGGGPSLEETSDARQTLVDLLENFLAMHSRSEDLGLRLRGEQLANGIRFVRMNKEGRYDVVVANPPYLGTSNVRNRKYIEKTYPRGKADLYACFLERGLQLTKKGGLSAMVTMRGWMFIKTYEDLRKALLIETDLYNIGDLGVGGFAEIGGHVVQATMTVIRANPPTDMHSVAVKLTDEDVSSSNRSSIKNAALLAQVGRYEFSAKALEGIEGQPLVYWWDEELLIEFQSKPSLGHSFPAKQGLITGENTRFLRKPWEVYRSDFLVQRHNEREKQSLASNLMPSDKWVPLIKGAAGTAWIEPLENLVRWAPNIVEIKLLEKDGKQASRPQNEQHFFRHGVAFATIGSSFSGRVHRFKSVFADTGASLFPKYFDETVCFLNSSKAKGILQDLNPTVHFTIGDVNKLPVLQIESPNSIFARLDEAFTEHEAARETSVEFKKPGPSCWEYAQDWAQRSVDRPAGEPLPAWEPVYDEAPAENWISWAIGVALGRFDAAGELGWLDEAPDEALESGILYVSATEFADSLSDPACALLHEMWQTHGDEVGRSKDDLSSWLREKFFKDVHRQMYDNAPIYFPLSSNSKNFVAHVSIHRWGANTLRALLAQHLLPEQRALEELRDSLRTTLDSSDGRDRTQADRRLDDTLKLLDELGEFIGLVRQCAEFGPPPTDSKCPPREVDAPYDPVLDDGTMINASALWPLLDSQWNYPKKWWKLLATEKGYRGKHFDWSKLAARYFPTRVDAKCQEDPSLAVAHGVFWKYHPARAYEWELRLQDEIGPEFEIEEEGAGEARERFVRECREEVERIREEEYVRRKRNAGLEPPLHHL